MGLITYHLFNIIVMGCTDHYIGMTVFGYRDPGSTTTKDYKISINNCKDQRLWRPTINSKCKDQGSTTIETNDQQILVKTKDQQKI